jgi:segregation and condensation protein B
MFMNETQLKNIIEAVLFAAGKAMSVDDILSLFEEKEQPEREQIRNAIKQLQEDFEGRTVELRQIASGYRIQVREGYSEWVSRLWTERPSRYSRALLETLALIAYRQPITRGEIEDIRGVSVSSSTIRTMLEREWIRVLGHRDVPGKPAMYGTTKQFLDYFNLKTLTDLPSLDELRDLDQINEELDLGLPGVPDVKDEVWGDETKSEEDNSEEAQDEKSADEEMVAEDGATEGEVVENKIQEMDVEPEQDEQVVNEVSTENIKDESPVVEQGNDVADIEMAEEESQEEFESQISVAES